MSSEEFGNADAYYEAFSTLLRPGIHDSHQALLRAHYAAPDHTTTWEALAQAVGYKRGAAVNLQYGKFAKGLAAAMGIDSAPHGFWLFVLADWGPSLDEESGNTLFVLRRPVIEALQRHGLLPARSSKQDRDPQPVLRRLIPEEAWSDAMEVLASSIGLVHSANPTTWGLGLSSRDVVLAIGPHLVLQISLAELPIRLIFESELAPEVIEDVAEVWFSGDRDRFGNEDAEGYYPSGPGSEACWTVFEDLRNTYEALLPAHTAIISQASRGAMDADIPHMHSARLVDFIAHEVSRSLPQPDYLDR